MHEIMFYRIPYLGSWTTCTYHIDSIFFSIKLLFWPAIWENWLSG